MSRCTCTHWFLRRVLRCIVRKYHDTIYVDHAIFKHALYRDFSQWFHFRKEETRDVLDMLARAFDGVSLSKHGLWIARSHLPEFQETGGDPDGAKA